MPRILLFGLLLSVALWAPACSDSTGPQDPAPLFGGAAGSGNVDPGAGEFVLLNLELPLDGARTVPVQLVGTNLATHPDSQRVALQVALRNLGTVTLYEPAAVWLADFTPPGVLVLNPDWSQGFSVEPNIDGPLADVFGFDYTGLLGPGGALAAGATSESKFWEFLDPGLLPFSFAARAEFGLEPDGPGLGGLCFWDADLDGSFGEGDFPLDTGVVRVEPPLGEALLATVGPRGRWSIPLRTPGLYRLTYDDLLETFAPIRSTTPNPLNVLITADAAGLPLSFLAADFGQGPLLPPPPAIRFSDLPADSLHHSHWSLLAAKVVEGRLLHLRVGLSGCQPDQPAALFASGGFREAEPVQMDVVFVNLGEEMCDAWFEVDRIFDLLPLIRAYAAAYGPGVLQLDLVRYDGTRLPLELPIYLPD